jgi:hypothetical protein
MRALSPAEIATRLRAGDDHIFFDASGARIAKAVGITARVAAVGDDRSVQFTISSGSLDRYNSTINQDGWQLDNFKRNPVVLWCHDDTIPAIARAENTAVMNGELRSCATFADADTHPLADTIYKLVKGGFLRGASVG